LLEVEEVTAVLETLKVETLLLLQSQLFMDKAEVVVVVEGVEVFTALRIEVGMVLLVLLD
jgi:hypothetical protein